MIVVAATAVGMGSVVLFGGRLHRLARIRLHRVWVMWLTLVVQTVLFEVPGPWRDEQLAELIHLGTYVAAFAFLWWNRHLPGALIIGVGAAANAAAIFANGGVMPAHPAAWRRAGFPDPTTLGFENSNVVADARLWFLGDVFAIPAGWPLANVFSVGDVVIVVGGTYLAHRVCRAATTADLDPTPGDPTPGSTAVDQLA